MPAVLKLLVCTDEVSVGVERVVQPIDALIAEADVAAQIPAAEILDHRGVHTGAARSPCRQQTPPRTTKWPHRRQ